MQKFLTLALDKVRFIELIDARGTWVLPTHNKRRVWCIDFKSKNFCKAVPTYTVSIYYLKSSGFFL